MKLSLSRGLLWLSGQLAEWAFQLQDNTRQAPVIEGVNREAITRPEGLHPPPSSLNGRGHSPLTPEALAMRADLEPSNYDMPDEDEPLEGSIEARTRRKW